MNILNEIVGGCRTDEAEGEAFQGRLMRSAIVALSDTRKEVIGIEGQAPHKVYLVNRQDKRGRLLLQRDLLNGLYEPLCEGISYKLR